MPERNPLSTPALGVVEWGLLCRESGVIKEGVNLLTRMGIWNKTLGHVGGEVVESLENREMQSQAWAGEEDVEAAYLGFP